MRPYKTSRDNTGPHRRLQDNTRTCRTIRDHTGPSMTILDNTDHVGPCGSIWNLNGLNRIILDNTGQY